MGKFQIMCDSFLEKINCLEQENQSLIYENSSLKNKIMNLEAMVAKNSIEIRPRPSSQFYKKTFLAKIKIKSQLVRHMYLE